MHGAGTRTPARKNAREREPLARTAVLAALAAAIVAVAAAGLVALAPPDVVQFVDVILVVLLQSL
jgi:hypothetical protein